MFYFKHRRANHNKFFKQKNTSFYFHTPPHRSHATLDGNSHPAERQQDGAHQRRGAAVIMLPTSPVLRGITTLRQCVFHCSHVPLPRCVSCMVGRPSRCHPSCTQHCQRADRRGRTFECALICSSVEHGRCLFHCFNRRCT